MRAFLARQCAAQVNCRWAVLQTAALPGATRLGFAALRGVPGPRKLRQHVVEHRQTYAGQRAETGTAKQAGGGNPVRHGLGSFAKKEALRIHCSVSGHAPIAAAITLKRIGGQELSQQV